MSGADWRQPQEQAWQQSIGLALKAAKAGSATDEEWQLIFWACGFSGETKQVNTQITDCAF